MEIDRIVNDAIPQDTCPVKEAAAKERRKVLKQRIEERDKSKPYEPKLEYKDSPVILGGRSEPWGGEPLNTSKNAIG